jgi:hypothetical protein
MTVAYAADQGDLQTRFADAAAQYERALVQFRQLLDEKVAAGNQSELRKSPVLLRQVRRCVELHRMAESLLKDSLSKDADPAAFESSARVYNALPPVYTAPLELAGGDTNGINSVVDDAIKQAALDEEARQRDDRTTRAKFLDELLKEAIGDAETAGDHPADAETTKSAGSDWDAGLFASLYRQFKSSSREFRVHASDFLDLLDQLAGTEEAHHLCEDPTLAYSYAETRRAAELLVVAYVDILRLLVPDWHPEDENPGMMEAFLPPYTHLPIEDQLALVEVRRVYSEDKFVGTYVERELKSKSEGCDPEDLLDRGNRTAEPGQDPETGVDGGSGTGGGPIDDGEFRFQRTGPVSIQQNLHATCDAGTISINVTSRPDFPERVTPDGTYTVSIGLTWSANGSGIEDIDVVVSVLFLGMYQAMESITSSSGTQTFVWTYRGSEVDFGLPYGVIMVQIIGGITCEGGSTGDLSAAFSQAYYRTGEN